MKNKIYTKSYFKKRLIEYFKSKGFKIEISDFEPLNTLDLRKWILVISLEKDEIREVVIIILYFESLENFYFSLNSKIDKNLYIYTKSMNVIINNIKKLFVRIEEK